MRDGEDMERMWTIEFVSTSSRLMHTWVSYSHGIEKLAQSVNPTTLMLSSAENGMTRRVHGASGMAHGTCVLRMLGLTSISVWEE